MNIVKLTTQKLAKHIIAKSIFSYEYFSTPCSNQSTW